MSDTRYRSHVGINDIEPSPTNPRKHFDEAALAELAANIKLHGVISPVLLRSSPLGCPNIYQLISGERRWRAAQMAGLETIPAIIRDDLSDAEIIELQIIENLQRQDLHELEEAEGYGLMMREHGYTADSLAEKIGKSRSYIFGRCKLLKLNEDGRRLFRAGLLNASTALYIARIPTHALQAKAIVDITAKDYRGDVMSVRQAQAHIQNRYMTKLDNAPFPIDADDLIATAGGCTACPKRTGNQPELFDDIDSGNVCTDPDCYSLKRMAQAERRAQAAGPDVKVITGAEAQKAMPEWAAESRTHVKLDQTCYDDPKKRTYREIMGEDHKGIALVEQPHKSDLIEVVEKKVIAEKLRNAGIVTGKDKEKAEAKRLQAKVDLANLWRDRLFRACRDKAHHDNAINLLTMVMPVIAHRFLLELGADRGGKVAGLWGALGSDNHTRWEAFKLALPSLTPGDLLRFCLDCALISEHRTDQYGYEREPAMLITIAQAFGIDHEAEFQAAKDEQKAADIAKKPKKTPKKSAPATPGEAHPPSEAAQAAGTMRAKTPGAAPEAAQAGEEDLPGKGNELSPAIAGEGDEKPSPRLACFKVGDRVRVKWDAVAEGGWILSSRGAVGTVTEGPDNEGYYVVSYEGNGGECFTGEQIEMYEKPIAPTDTEPAEPKRQSTKVPIKYRHPENADLCWSGRGRQPKWVEHYLANGHTLADLEITGETA